MGIVWGQSSNVAGSSNFSRITPYFWCDSGLQDGKEIKIIISYKKTEILEGWTSPEDTGFTILHSKGARPYHSTYFILLVTVHICLCVWCMCMWVQRLAYSITLHSLSQLSETRLVARKPKWFSCFRPPHTLEQCTYGHGWLLMWVLGIWMQVGPQV